MSSTKVFVYGSLKRGNALHAFMESSSFIGTYRIDGYALYEYDGYSFPVAVEGIPGEDGFVGELFEVDDAVLKRLDIVEGYNNKKNPEKSLFLRKTVNVVGVDEPVEMFVFNRFEEEKPRRQIFNFNKDGILVDDDIIYEFVEGDVVFLAERKTGQEISLSFDNMSLIKLNMQLETQGGMV